MYSIYMLIHKDVYIFPHIGKTVSVKTDGSSLYVMSVYSDVPLLLYNCKASPITIKIYLLLATKACQNTPKSDYNYYIILFKSYANS